MNITNEITKPRNLLLQTNFPFKFQISNCKSRNKKKDKYTLPILPPIMNKFSQKKDKCRKLHKKPCPVMASLNSDDDEEDEEQTPPIH